MNIGGLHFLERTSAGDLNLIYWHNPRRIVWGWVVSWERSESYWLWPWLSLSYIPGFQPQVVLVIFRRRALRLTWQPFALGNDGARYNRRPFI